MPTRPPLLVAAVLAATMTVAGCAGATDATRPGTGSGDTEGRSAPVPAASGSGFAGSADPAGSASGLLDFTATTVDGGQLRGADLAGRPVLLWFWAPWCPTCAGQAPSVRAAADQFRDRAAVVGVAGLDGRPAMATFVDRHKLAGTWQVADESGALWRRFAVTQQSTFVLLDAAGSVVFRGYLDGKAVAGRLGALVG